MALEIDTPEQTPAGGCSRRRFLETTATLGGGTVLAALGALAQARPAARQAATARRDELLALLETLVGARSHSGESAAEAQGIVATYLRSLGYDLELSEDVPSRLSAHPEYMPPSPPGDGPFVNVVARPPAGRTVPLGVFAHIDTEPVYEGWSADPYRLRHDGNRLYGLGTADDKGGVAAMLVAVAILAEGDHPLPTVMSLHGKGGGSRGSLPVFERVARQGTRLDAVLYSHPAETGHGLAEIKHVVKGALDLTLSVTGWQGPPLEIGSPQSARFHAGGDALRACWAALEALRTGRLADHEMNVGEMQAGDRVGAVPATARARIRILFEDEIPWADLLADLRADIARRLDTMGSEAGQYSFELAQDGLATNYGAVDWEDPYCRDLRAAIADVTGTAPAPYRNHYAGDIRYPIRLLGTPAFGIGSLGGNFYGPDEWVDADDLVLLAATIADTVRRWTRA